MDLWQRIREVLPFTTSGTDGDGDGDRESLR